MSYSFFVHEIQEANVDMREATLKAVANESGKNQSCL